MLAHDPCMARPPCPLWAAVPCHLQYWRSQHLPWEGTLQGHTPPKAPHPKGHEVPHARSWKVRKGCPGPSASKHCSHRAPEQKDLGPLQQDFPPKSFVDHSIKIKFQWAFLGTFWPIRKWIRKQGRSRIAETQKVDVSVRSRSSSSRVRVSLRQKMD